jgi:hypothetical protein
MNFLLKNRLFHKLQDVEALEADKRLLVERNPGSKVLTVKFFDRHKESKEILYDLLDYATEEEIVNNRTGKAVKVIEIKVKDIDTALVPAPVKKKSRNKRGHKR